MAKPQDLSISLVRRIKVAPEKVFQAWTEPETLKHWMAPSDEMTVPLAETDLRVGGRYRIIMKEPGGEEHRVGGIYREIVPGKRLAFTWAWESSPQDETLVEIDLRPADDGTELTLTHTRFAEKTSRDRHEHGWTGCVGRLERLMAA